MICKHTSVQMSHSVFVPSFMSLSVLLQSAGQTDAETVVPTVLELFRVWHPLKQWFSLLATHKTV